MIQRWDVRIRIKDKVKGKILRLRFLDNVYGYGL
jgi:hypothetical protein